MINEGQRVLDDASVGPPLYRVSRQMAAKGARAGPALRTARACGA